MVQFHCSIIQLTTLSFMIPTNMTKSEIARDNFFTRRKYLGTSIDRFINYELRNCYSEFSLEKTQLKSVGLYLLARPATARST